MAMTTASAHALALLLFNNTTMANWGDATGIVKSTAAGSEFIGLHTADPGLVGDQTTSETAYTGYGTRPGVSNASGGAGWTVGTGGAVTNTAVVTFPACSGGSASTCSYLSLGFAATATGSRHASGAISSPSGGLIVNPGITPSFAIGALTTTVS